jgi:hypothetical protein
LDLHGNDTGNRKGLLEWLLGTFKGLEVKCIIIIIIIKEMEQLRIDIASKTETKKKGSRSEVCGNYSIYNFIVASQKKTGQRQEFLYCSTNSSSSIPSCRRGT